MTASGAIVWFTGLPASGKSTLARAVRDRLTAAGRASVLLDGDDVRAALVPSPGYSEAERDNFYQTLGNLSRLVAGQGLVVLVPATAHLRRHREHASRGPSPFLLVHVATPVEECAGRDDKGLYARARADADIRLPGVRVAFQEPDAPDFVASGGLDEATAERIATALCQRPPSS